MDRCPFSVGTLPKATGLSESLDLSLRPGFPLKSALNTAAQITLNPSAMSAFS